MNYHGLFVKVMERGVPNQLLSLLEDWFKNGVRCVKWGTVISSFYELACGIGLRQGGVLSPYLFALYIGSRVDRA